MAYLRKETGVHMAAKKSHSPHATTPTHLEHTPDDSQSVDIPTPPVKREKTFMYSLMVIALFFVLANVVVFLYLQWKTKALIEEANRIPTPTPTVTLTPTPTPTPYPLPQGKQSFQLNYGKTATGPRLKSVTIDSFDPKIGAPQTYTITASYAQPITSVSLILATDTKTATYSMERISGSDTDGTWETTITTDDTHFYQYYAKFLIKSTIESFEGGLTFRAY